MLYKNKPATTLLPWADYHENHKGTRIMPKIIIKKTNIDIVYRTLNLVNPFHLTRQIKEIVVRLT